MVLGGEAQRRLARAGEVDLVAAGPEVDAERAQDLRLVVDDEDAGHGAACRRRTTVSPPPGVSSTSISPPIASTKPLATARPSPTPPSWGLSPSRWNGSEHALALRRRHARAAVDDAQVDPIVDGAGVEPHVGARWRVANRVRDDVGDRPLEQAGVGQDPRQRLRDADVDVRGDRRPRLRSAAGTISSRPTGRGVDLQRAGLQPAHVEQVADERVEPVGLLVDRLQEGVAFLRRPVDVGRAGGS